MVKLFQDKMAGGKFHIFDLYIQIYIQTNISPPQRKSTKTLEIKNIIEPTKYISVGGFKGKVHIFI